MVVVGLVGLRGKAWWRGGGFENLACGEKRSLQWSEKKQKRRKKHNFTCAHKCRQWRQQVWGLRERGNGGMVVCMPPDGVIVTPLA